MNTTEDLKHLQNQILHEMYAEAQPPLDFDYVLGNPEKMDDGWYKQHYLSQEEQQRIFREHVEDENLTDGERTALSMACLLSLGPASSPDEKK